MLLQALARPRHALGHSLSRGALGAYGPARACSNGGLSFIERAKLFGANALLGAFTHRGGFDSSLDNMKIEELKDGRAVCSVLVERKLENAYNTLHGGAVATLVDVVGTLALLSKEPTRAGVSVEMNVSFLAAARDGETVTAEGRLLRVGKKLAFTEVEVRGEDGRLVATGRHTKAV